MGQPLSQGNSHKMQCKLDNTNMWFDLHITECPKAVPAGLEHSLLPKSHHRYRTHARGSYHIKNTLVDAALPLQCFVHIKLESKNKNLKKRLKNTKLLGLTVTEMVDEARRPSVVEFIHSTQHFIFYGRKKSLSMLQKTLKSVIASYSSSLVLRLSITPWDQST